jgi:hypothetical protein
MCVRASPWRIDGRTYKALGFNGRIYKALGIYGRDYKALGIKGRNYKALDRPAKPPACPQMAAVCD